MQIPLYDYSLYWLLLNGRSERFQMFKLCMWLLASKTWTCIQEHPLILWLFSFVFSLYLGWQVSYARIGNSLFSSVLLFFWKLNLYRPTTEYDYSDKLLVFSPWTKGSELGISYLKLSVKNWILLCFYNDLEEAESETKTWLYELFTFY